MNFISEIINNRTELINNSITFETKSGYSKIKAFKCLKVLLSKKGLKKNISSYLIIFIFIQFITSNIIFFKYYGFKLLEENINHILEKKESNEKNNNYINEIASEGHLKNGIIKRNIGNNSFNLPQILSASVHNVKQINDISNNFNSEIKFKSLRINNIQI